MGLPGLLPWALAAIAAGIAHAASTSCSVSVLGSQAPVVTCSAQSGKNGISWATGTHNVAFSCTAAAGTLVITALTALHITLAACDAPVLQVSSSAFSLFLSHIQ